MKKKFILFILTPLCIALGLSLSACQKKTNEKEKLIPFDVFITGQASGYGLDEGRVFFIPNEEQWSLFLKVHNPYDVIPPVNFEEQGVLIVVDKNHPTGGYTLTIDKLEKSEQGGTDVFVTREVPGANCMTTMAMTQPFMMVKVPKDQIHEPIQLHIEDKEITC